MTITVDETTDAQLAAISSLPCEYQPHPITTTKGTNWVLRITAAHFAILPDDTVLIGTNGLSYIKREIADAAPSVDGFMLFGFPGTVLPPPVTFWGPYRSS
jgi:hypothetical protein